VDAPAQLLGLPMAKPGPLPFDIIVDPLDFEPVSLRIDPNHLSPRRTFSSQTRALHSETDRSSHSFVGLAVLANTHKMCTLSRIYTRPDTNGYSFYPLYSSTHRSLRCTVSV